MKTVLAGRGPAVDGAERALSKASKDRPSTRELFPTDVNADPTPPPPPPLPFSSRSARLADGLGAPSFVRSSSRPPRLADEPLVDGVPASSDDDDTPDEYDDAGESGWWCGTFSMATLN